MNIGIVSGKGGTGKTFVSTNLAYTASRKIPVTLCDLDVEEPNVNIFFNGKASSETVVSQMIPKVFDEKCSGCGTCSKVCEFNAIINLGCETLVFPELCHSCYSCLELCPNNAIEEGSKEIGKVKIVRDDKLNIIEGKLKVNETASPALIREVKKVTNLKSAINVYDCPPGNSCSVIEAIRGIDYVIVVTEPTIFGLHDFELIAQTLLFLNKSFGVIINKEKHRNNLVNRFCQQNEIDIVGRIPLDIKIAEAYSRAKIAVKKNHRLYVLFSRIIDNIYDKVSMIPL